MDLIERKPPDGIPDPSTSFEILFSNNPQPMWVFDLETLAFLDVNQAVTDLYGYSRDEFLAMRITDIRPPEDVPALMEIIRTAAPVMQKNGEWRHLTRDGRLLNVLVTTHAIQHSGRPAVLVLITDITEHKQASRRLQQSEQHYKSLFESNQDAIAMLDREGHLTSVNPATERLTGYSADELVGRHFTTLLSPDLVQRSAETFRKALSAPQDIESALVHKNGTRVEVYATGTPIVTDGEATGLYVVAHDISERKKAESTTQALMAQVHRERQRLDDLLSHVPGVVWEFWMEPDPALNRINYVSKHVEAMLGYPVSAWTEDARFWVSVVHPEDRERAQAESWEHMQSGKGGVSQFRCITKDGRTLWLESRCVCVHDEDGRLVGLRGVNMDVTDRKRAHAALRESEERFRLLAENASDFISRHAADGAYLYASPSIRNLCGYDPEEMAGRSPFEFIHPDDVPAVERTLNNLLEGPGITTQVYRFRRRDGGYLWLETASHTVGTPGQEDFEIHCASRNVTERQEALEALRQSEERYRLVERATDDVIWDWDLITGELRHNDSLVTVFGYPPGDTVRNGQWWFERTHPEDRRRVVQDIWDVINGGGSYWTGEYRFARGDGTWANVLDRSYVMRSESGVPLRMIGSMTDITERKRTEEALRFLATASETLSASLDYHTTLTNLTRAVIPFLADYCAVDIFEEDGTVRRIAIAHVDPSKEKVLRGIQTHIFTGTRTPHVLLRALRNGHSHLIEDVTQNRVAATEDEGASDLDQTFRVISPRSYMGVPLHAHGRTFGAISFVSSESGRRYTSSDLALASEVARRASVALDNARLYREIQHADIAKDEFLAMLSHELRNPLSAIANAMQLIRLRDSVDPATHRTLDVVDRQARHMTRLVDDLLDVSRITRGKIELRREVMPLADVVDQAVQSVQPLINTREHSLCLEMPPEPVWLNADPFRIAQVVSNLLNNAAKYTDTGGRITLCVESDDDHAVIRVRDTGMGIPSELLPRVFDMFTQADRSLDRAQGGLGIGLTVVKSLVEMHGGSVRALSEGPGQGSEFIIRLPAVPEPAASPADPSGETEPDEPTRLRIMVVEDNVDAARTLSEILTLWGYSVQMAHDGLMALDVAAAFHPDVVLMDIGLPGMDGHEVARRMRSEGRGDALHLVALTGYGQEEDQRRSFDSGFNDHLVKPVNFELLRCLLTEIKLQ